MSSSDRRLIEEAFPIKDISFEAIREKNIRRGNISTLHVWWARRPTVACRAAILASLLKCPVTDEQKTELLHFLSKFSTWESSNDAQLIEKARAMIMQTYNKQSPKVLDSFAGGGAIPLEALRIGCEAYAVDLNPVAVIVERCTLVYPMKYGTPMIVPTVQTTLQGKLEETIPNRLAYDVKKYGMALITEARQELACFYPPERNGIPIAYLWARTVKCPNPGCGADFPLIKQLWLANRGNKKIALRLCPSKKHKRIDLEIVEGKRIDFDPTQGTMKKGNAECPVCLQSAKGEYLREEASSGRLSQRLMVVVTKKKARKAGSEKHFRIATDDDSTRFKEASIALKNRLGNMSPQSSNPVPDEPIMRPPRGSSLKKLDPFYVHLQVVNYGLTRWGDILNCRQALTLVVLIEATKRYYDLILKDTGDAEYARAVTTYLALAVNRYIDYNTTLTRWDNTQQRSVGLFARQAIAMVWDYAELNPFERVVGGLQPMLDAIIAVINKLSEIRAPPATVSQGSATKLTFGDCTFDAVITDPPYYDAVPYSDLSDFFYVLLKRTIGSLYPDLFAAALTPKSQEIIQNSSLLRRLKLDPKKIPSGIKDRQFFETEMTKALKEVNRVLKTDGICTLVFASKTITAWETLIDALLNAGFTITSSWPIRTEQRQRLRAHGSAALASSVWLVCRKRDLKAGNGTWQAVQRELSVRVKERLELFQSAGLKGADVLLSAIGPALEVFGKYKAVEKVTGEKVTTGELLDKVREEVAHHALSAVLSQQELGKVDPMTAFYVLWKWTFEPAVKNEAATNVDGKITGNGNHIRVSYDDALKLARSVEADMGTLIKRHILKQDKEYVSLLGPVERKTFLGGGGRVPSEDAADIDRLHHAINLWAAMEHEKLEEYLESAQVLKAEAFWRIAQALSNLLPIQSKEKQLLDGLLAWHANRFQSRDSFNLDQFKVMEDKRN